MALQFFYFIWIVLDTVVDEPYELPVDNRGTVNYILMRNKPKTGEILVDERWAHGPGEWRLSAQRSVLSGRTTGGDSTVTVQPSRVVLVPCQYAVTTLRWSDLVVISDYLTESSLL